MTLNAGYHADASVLETIGSSPANVDKFSSVIESYTVTFFFNGTIPTNTLVTVTIFATKPIWFQMSDAKSLAYYFNTLNTTPDTLPDNLTSSQACRQLPFL